MELDIGVTEIVTIIASSTTSYFSVYSPLFLLIGGIVLAFAVIEMLLDRFFPQKEYTENKNMLD